MSLLRRRKSRASRARERRRQLVERERLTYEVERAGEASAPAEAAPRQTPAPPRPARRRTRGGRRSVSAAPRRILSVPLRLAGLVERMLLAVFDGAHAAGHRILAFLERQATPQRALVAVICAAAACLVYSQFVTFRWVEVGQRYSAVSSVAPAPQTDPIDAGEAHAYVMIPLAVLAVAIAVAALLSGRWRLGRLISAIGLAGVAISLAIDLPKGLDAGAAGASYADANATLSEGFYAQLAASAVLALCGWTLSTSDQAGAGALLRLRRRRRRQPPPRRAPSVAEGR
jgi:hypothetical protein